jgi:hypothetical protein
VPEQSALDQIFETLRQFLVREPVEGSLQFWPGGPEAVLRSEDIDINHYIDCIRELEAGPVGAQGIRVLVQRMRRLYFSVYTMKVDKGKPFVGVLLDMLAMPMMNLSDPPLTTAHLSQESLDTLYKTSAATTLVSKVAISHVWTALDIALNGVNPAAAAAEGLILKSPIPALATWLGDLASAVLWFERIMLPDLPTGDSQQARRARLQAMVNSIRKKAGSGDMLGNFDGTALGLHIARSPQSFRLSDVLQEYYDNESLSMNAAAQLGRPSASHRFHYFLKHMDPQLPCSGLDSVPFVATFDKLSAMNRLPQIVEDACEDMNLVGRVRLFGRDPLKFIFDDSSSSIKKSITERLDRRQGLHAFHWLCDDFCRFLDSGVQFGTGGWPSNI